MVSPKEKRRTHLALFYSAAWVRALSVLRDVGGTPLVTNDACATSALPHHAPPWVLFLAGALPWAQEPHFLSCPGDCLGDKMYCFMFECLC